MAIYPYFSTTIINKDVLINSSFKAGMALVLDNNGRAIKADSQLLLFDSAAQKYGKFLGFATSDHDISGNTIIIPDVIGSNYLDSNLNFVTNENTEYSVAKRSLLDYQDSAVSNFYNASDLNTISKRGIGVYNTPGDYFVTDQFNPVLHGDYGLDSSTTTTLNPGDLLTFGGGINAGKLVKVNINSFGPDVIVIGKVYKHLPNSGLLYFRQVSYNLSFGTNPYILALDAGNPISYVSGSTNTINLANSTSGGTLINGTSFSPANSGSWVLDGANDYISTSFSGSFTTNATIVMWIQLDVENPPSGTGGLLGFDDGGAVGPSYYTFYADGKAYINVFRNNRIGPITLGSTVKTQPHMVTITTDGTDWKFYQNTSLITTAVAQATVRLVLPYIGRGYYDVMFQGKVFQFNLLNQALTATQITNYYNATKGRYGL
jgi:hypothetical protein